MGELTLMPRTPLDGYKREFDGLRLAERSGMEVVSVAVPAHARDEARASLAGWSRSADVLARQIPGTRIVPVAIEGVIAPRARRHLWVRAARGDPARRDWLAATCQALCPDRYRIAPSVRFASPVDAANDTHTRLIDTMQALYASARPNPADASRPRTSPPR